MFDSLALVLWYNPAIPTSCCCRHGNVPWREGSPSRDGDQGGRAGPRAGTCVPWQARGEGPCCRAWRSTSMVQTGRQNAASGWTTCSSGNPGVHWHHSTPAAPQHTSHHSIATLQLHHNTHHTASCISHTANIVALYQPLTLYISTLTYVWQYLQWLADDPTIQWQDWKSWHPVLLWSCKHRESDLSLCTESTQTANSKTVLLEMFCYCLAQAFR